MAALRLCARLKPVRELIGSVTGVRFHSVLEADLANQKRVLEPQVAPVINARRDFVFGGVNCKPEKLWAAWISMCFGPCVKLLVSFSGMAF